MKNLMITILGLLICFSFPNLIIRSQSIGNAEILIKNISDNEIEVSIYPASAIFSGYNVTTSGFNYKYSFSRARRDGNPPL